ncbi:MAG: molybdopterin-dependent oxidoreductase [Candidatus Eisenbacteria bacterium]|uniref:Molybdopterin-dependent oxidoreductase n=1 Tax=Eiseniibacteriota bacterium TaxID=2212470 RepID=A0A849SAJ9_UNCEI|nr:molybdopterin-dependent oxidoreductase [Candidatus Eisenbacteria bacterium]
MSGGDKKRGDAAPAGSTTPPPGMAIPKGRTMPREDRLTPPQWEGGRSQPPNDSNFRMIGRRNRKIEGLAKVTGRAVYADDLTLPRMLHAKLLRSIHPHARIRSIDASKALAMPGVHAVITGRDLPIYFGIIPWTEDEQALCEDKARYVGDAIAAVAADTELLAEEALRAILVDYEPLPAVIDIESALAHPEWKVNEKAEEGNISKHVHLAFGDVEAGLADSDAVVEGEYWYEGSTHAPIEPHCALADFDATGFLTLYSSTQVAHYLHRDLAKVLELPTQRVRVIQPVVGGAFGGKSEPFSLEFCAAKLSMVTGRPVKILYTREEVFYAHRGRHPMRLAYRTGIKQDGSLTAVDAKIHIDGGAYSSFGLVTTYYSGQLLTAPYGMPAYRFDSTRVFTNKPCCGPKRGHGSVQPRFAFECQLDKLSEAIGMDPIAVRRKNFIGENTRTVNGMRVTSNGFLQCLEAIESASEWKQKFRRLPYGRGVGVAGSMYISGTNYCIYPNEMPQSAVQLKLDRSGRATVFCGISDIGQGAESVLAYIVCEELGLELRDVRVVAADTDLTPVDLGSYSSRETFMCGNACLDAARKLRELVAEALAKQWGVDKREIVLAGGVACATSDPEKHAMSVKRAFQLAEARNGTLGSVGWYQSPKLGGDYRGGTIGASPAYSFTAHIAQVACDPETGFVKVEKIWVAHDCGRALNPVTVEGQMEGSAYMGFGEAIFEEQSYKAAAPHHGSGIHHGPSLLDYRIPTSLDTPELESFIIESVDPEGPYGAKEAGEGPLHPSVPAISNAIYDALGIRCDRLPFSPPRVLSQLGTTDARAAWEKARAGLAAGAKR